MCSVEADTFTVDTQKQTAYIPSCVNYQGDSDASRNSIVSDLEREYEQTQLRDHGRYVMHVWAKTKEDATAFALNLVQEYIASKTED
jgi:hypothetical protein